MSEVKHTQAKELIKTEFSKTILTVYDEKTKMIVLKITTSQLAQYQEEIADYLGWYAGVIRNRILQRRRQGGD